MAKKINKTPRYLAVELLEKVEKQGAYSNLALNQTIKQNELSKRDAHLLTNIVHAVPFMAQIGMKNAVFAFFQGLSVIIVNQRFCWLIIIFQPKSCLLIFFTYAIITHMMLS